MRKQQQLDFFGSYFSCLLNNIIQLPDGIVSFFVYHKEEKENYLRNMFKAHDENERFKKKNLLESIFLVPGTRC